jgi:hypothetical protein
MLKRSHGTTPFVLFSVDGPAEPDQPSTQTLKDLLASVDTPETLPWLAATPDVFRLWDNRFWIRLRSRLRGAFAIAFPTERQLHVFRSALSHDDDARLRSVLAAHAPGKTRLTLPALYILHNPSVNTLDDGNATLVALPSLGIGLAGLDKWVCCQVRYKQVDDLR